MLWEEAMPNCMKYYESVAGFGVIYEIIVIEAEVSHIFR